MRNLGFGIVTVSWILLCITMKTSLKSCDLTHQDGLLPVVDPPPGGKVGGLGAVKTVVKSGVVSVRERDHELAGFLRDLKQTKVPGCVYVCADVHVCVRGEGGSYLFERDAVFLQDGGRDQSHLVSEKRFTVLRATGKESCTETKTL